MRITNILRQIIRYTAVISYLGISAATSSAQTNPGNDTLQLIENYASNKEFEKALHLLKYYRPNHKDNSKALRLELKITYWINAAPDLKKEYQQALIQFPEDRVLQLDYAIYLYEHQENAEAFKQLKAYTKTDTINLQAKYILGLICYANGDLQSAQRYMKEILSKDPSNSNALNAYNELILLTSLYINLKSAYYSDRQPIKKLIITTECGIYRSKLFAPFARISLQGIKDHPDYSGIELGNRIQFPKQLYTTLQAGIAKLPATIDNVVFIYDILCKKNIGKNISLYANIYSKPYLYTYSSLLTAVTPVTFSAYASWGKTYSPFERSNNRLKDISSWTINSGFIQQHYQDNNTTTTIYAWALSPVINWNNLQLRLGYSYSYSNSNELRYESTLSLKQIETNWSQYTPVQGFYNPYFTPIHQSTNSIITQANYLAGTKCFVSYKGTIGFYAQGDAPYIYIDNVHNQLAFIEGTSTQRYTPFEFQLSTGIKISNKTTLNAAYIYTRAFFFDSQQIQFGLTHIFTNE